MADEVEKVKAQGEDQGVVNFYADLPLQWRSGLLVMKSDPSNPVLMLTISQLDVGMNRQEQEWRTSTFSSTYLMYL